VSCSDFLIFSNNQIIATGRLFESPTFNEARTKLILELVDNNMPVRLLSETYKIRTNNVGDFNIIRTRHNGINERIEDLSWIYFIRGTKVISLRSKNIADVQPIAEVLDALLKNPPTSQ